MKNVKIALSLLLCGSILCGCGEENEMQYIKTSVMYETFYDMYSDPEAYLGKQYHMVGELYVHDDADNDETIYSVYCEQDGAGLGVELDWDNFDGLVAGGYHYRGGKTGTGFWYISRQCGRISGAACDHARKKK